MKGVIIILVNVFMNISVGIVNKLTVGSEAVIM